MNIRFEIKNIDKTLVCIKFDDGLFYSFGDFIITIFITMF
jgi:hypothetical protein